LAHLLCQLIYLFHQYDWDDLPPKIQAAATVLGYTQAIWDEGEEPASSDKDWAKLSATERKAGKMLGYDEVCCIVCVNAFRKARLTTRNCFATMQLMWDNDDSKDTEGASTYDDYDWHELPVEVQKAARVLGYTSSMWDSDKEPKTCEKDWGRLTSEERVSASKLGYDQSKWEGGKDSERYGENDGPTKARTKVTEGTSVSYDDLDWDDLPVDVQEAAKILGYTSRMWDNDREPKLSDKDWKELTAAEQEAAEKLGYSQLEWDSDDDSAPVLNYDDLTWRKLPVNVQEAAKVLGYTPKMWNNDQEPDACDKDWNELTSKEREAASKLGYDKKKWKDGSEGNEYDDLTWRKLPVDVQEAAQVLGYTPKMWNNDQEPDTCDKLWEELSSDEREAATRLGYTKIKWNGESKSHATTTMVKKEAASVVEGTSVGESGANTNVDSDKNHANSDDYTWRNLPAAIQEAATTLGYTPMLWNENQEPITCKRNWRDLTSDERKAAKILGYDDLQWDGDSELN
jgi:hypothetical protein